MINTVQYSSIQFDTVQYSSIQFDTVRYSLIQFDTVRYSSIQFDKAIHSSIQFVGEIKSLKIGNQKFKKSNRVLTGFIKKRFKFSNLKMKNRNDTQIVKVNSQRP